MVDKTKLKVWEVPFSTTVTGTIFALAESQKEACDHLISKINDGSFAFDEDNLCEEGVLHDGSISLNEINTSPIEQAGEAKLSSMEPSQHPDWDAFDDPADEEAASV